MSPRAWAAYAVLTAVVAGAVLVVIVLFHAAHTIWSTP